MQMPERFDLEYIDKDGSKKRPVMIHRVSPDPRGVMEGYWGGIHGDFPPKLSLA